MKLVTRSKITMKRGESEYPFIEVSSVEDVKKYVHEQTPYKKDAPGLMVWDKNYLVLNFDKEIVTFDQDIIISDSKNIQTFNRHPIVSSDFKRFHVYIMKKLQYANDIKKYLDDNYAGTIDFNHVATDMPIAFGGWTFQKDYSMERKEPIKIQVKKAVYSYIRDKDIVVDENLNQIWPKNTGKLPVGLAELFSKER